MDCPYCIDHLNYTVTVAAIETRCKYHCRCGLTYDKDAVAPRGLCRELFFAAYPAALALLYGGRPRRAGWRSAWPVAGDGGLPGPSRGHLGADRRRHPAATRCRRSKIWWKRPARSSGGPWTDICAGFSLTLRRWGRPAPTDIASVSGSNSIPAGATNCARRGLRPSIHTCGAWRGAPGVPLHVHCPDHVGVTYRLQAAIACRRNGLP